MNSVIHIANNFLQINDGQCESDLITNLKIQKLCYYAQGFHLALYNTPLFQENIEAWKHGPVIRELYNEYKQYGDGAIPMPENMDMGNLSQDQKDLIIEVWDVYGQFSAWKLRNMTDQESPWKDTPLDTVISHESLEVYFKTQLCNNIHNFTDPSITDAKKQVKTIDVTLPPDTKKVTYIIRLIFPDGYTYAAVPNSLKETLEDHVKNNTISLSLPKDEFLAKLKEKNLLNRANLVFFDNNPKPYIQGALMAACVTTAIFDITKGASISPITIYASIKSVFEYIKKYKLKGSDFFQTEQDVIDVLNMVNPELSFFEVISNNNGELPPFHKKLEILGYVGSERVSDNNIFLGGGING